MSIRTLLLVAFVALVALTALAPEAAAHHNTKCVDGRVAPVVVCVPVGLPCHPENDSCGRPPDWP